VRLFVKNIRITSRYFSFLIRYDGNAMVFNLLKYQQIARSTPSCLCHGTSLGKLFTLTYVCPSSSCLIGHRVHWRSHIIFLTVLWCH